jgi:hypothetical protein
MVGDDGEVPYQPQVEVDRGRWRVRHVVSIALLSTN